METTRKVDAMKSDKKAAFAGLIKKIAALDEAQKIALAAKMPIINTEGHPLSVRNQCLLAFQAASVITVVGGYRQWQSQGRSVRAGKGLMILVPCAGKKSEDGEPGKVFFVAGTVWDISETDPLTETQRAKLAERSGETQPEKQAPVIQQPVDNYFSEEFTPINR